MPAFVRAGDDELPFRMRVLDALPGRNRTGTPLIGWIRLRNSSRRHRLRSAVRLGAELGQVDAVRDHCDRLAETEATDILGLAIRCCVETGGGSDRAALAEIAPDELLASRDSAIAHSENMPCGERRAVSGAGERPRRRRCSASSRCRCCGTGLRRPRAARGASRAKCRGAERGGGGMGENVASSGQLPGDRGQGVNVTRHTLPSQGFGELDDGVAGSGSRPRPSRR